MKIYHCKLTEYYDDFCDVGERIWENAYFDSLDKAKAWVVSKRSEIEEYVNDMTKKIYYNAWKSVPIVESETKAYIEWRPDYCYGIIATINEVEVM